VGWSPAPVGQQVAAERTGHQPTPTRMSLKIPWSRRGHTAGGHPASECWAGTSPRGAPQGSCRLPEVPSRRPFPPKYPLAPALPRSRTTPAVLHGEDEHLGGLGTVVH